MVEEVSPEELKHMLDAGEDVQVVDIRPAREFRAGHIPGAENVPFDEFARAVEDREWGDRVVVACPVGQSSRRACRLLVAYEGVDDDAEVANLTGGYRAWEYDLETADPDDDGRAGDGTGDGRSGDGTGDGRSGDEPDDRRSGDPDAPF